MAGGKLLRGQALSAIFAILQVLEKYEKNALIEGHFSFLEQFLNGGWIYL
jgi:hypothetical protein